MTPPEDPVAEAARHALERAVGAVEARIAAASRRAGRDRREVTLVAATKTVPVQTLRWARDLGIEHFGENRAGDLATKAEAVAATWHFFGKLQRGTAARIADHADWIHSGEPGSGLDRVARRAHARGRALRCLLQVDFTGRRQGVAPSEAAAFLDAAADLPAVTWSGLMTLPPWTGAAEATRPYFARLRELRDGLSTRWPVLRELSMGMSADYEVAVEEGATMLRLGTALFGERSTGRPGVP